MEGSCMTTATVPEIRVALAIKAYGMEIQLWKEVGQREWGATLRDDTTILHCHFEEDSLPLAKLHLLGEARNRAVTRSGNTGLPGCDTFFDAWKPIKMTKA